MSYINHDYRQPVNRKNQQKNNNLKPQLNHKNSS